MTSGGSRWALLLFVLLAAHSEAKSVKIGVEASWSDTSLASEASAFFDDAAPEALWKYIDQLATMQTLTDEKAHAEAMRLCEVKFGSSRAALLRMALAIREYSPRVEVLRQVAQAALAAAGAPDRVAAGLVLGETVHDTVESLEQALPGTPLTIEPAGYEYAGGAGPVVKLVGSFSDQQFRSLHEGLKDLSAQGRVRYCLVPFTQSSNKKVDVSGYGVELAIKNMEYKAVDDRQPVQNVKEDSDAAVDLDEEIGGFYFNRLLKRKPALQEALQGFKHDVLASIADANQPLKVWEIKHLGVQALQRIQSAPEPLRVLRDLCHNLPIAARSMHRLPVNKTIADALAGAERLIGQYGAQTFVSLNKKPMTMGLNDPFTLFRELLSEINMLDAVQSLSLSSSAVGALRELASSSKSSAGIRIDARSPVVHYVNNLEQDSGYLRWPKSVQALLQPNWPGQMYYVRKNLITLVLVFDPADDQGLQMAAMAAQIMQQQMPIRIGIAPVVSASQQLAEETQYEWCLEELGVGGSLFQCSASEAVAQNRSQTISEKTYRLYRYVRFKKDTQAGLNFLLTLFQLRQTDGAPAEPLDEPGLREAFSTFMHEEDGLSRREADELYDAQMTAKRFNNAVQSATRYVQQKGFQKLPVGVLNGRIMEGAQIARMLMQGIMTEQQSLQQMVHKGEINDETNIEDFLLDHHGALEHYHPDLATNSPTVVSMTAGMDPPTEGDGTKPQLTRELLLRTQYFRAADEEHQPASVTIWVVADLSTPSGIHTATQALHYSRAHTPAFARVAILSPSSGLSKALVPRVVSAAASLAHTHVNMSSLGAAVLELADRNVDVPLKAVEHLAGLFLPPDAAERLLKKVSDQSHWDALFQLQAKFCDTVLGLHEAALVTNGRVVKAGAGSITSNDIHALALAEFKLRASAAGKLIATDLEAAWTVFGAAERSTKAAFHADQLLLASSVFFAPAKEKTDSAMRSAYMPPAFEKESQLLAPLTVHTGTPNAPLSIVAALDPLSKDAQQLAPVLLFLSENFEVSIKLILYPPSNLAELPLRNFYRYVLPPNAPEWAPDGSRKNQPRALFERLPESQMLTLNLDTPSAWQMEPVTSGHDMDNIKLADVNTDSVFAKYKIAALYVQGNAADGRTPPRGVELALDDASGSTISDTIVMANLGYFQLQAQPGSFALHTVAGRSSELYSLIGGDNLRNGSSPDQMVLTVESFLGTDVSLQVKKRSGKENEELLQVPEGAQGAAQLGLYQKLRSSLWGASDKGSDSKLATAQDETIHVFSLASGHLYERFLRIMMLSVIKTTKSPVKFWFLKNFLSARFTQFFLPKIAKQYNIQYELVTYRWPSWLHQQTERQRIIWGHKILFLDVLFPLSVKKVVYIDADQVVRGDLKQLWDMDLQGAPLAMTPMCDSRKEVEGFRFWKQGFWKSHLAGKPYHISALFVVDLEMWRATAAGDQIRVVYEQLSKDKNSLANLDQDLPNYAQHQVPIFSLPQDWLWCGSWCSQESKGTAQTIDLCNDPLKKTPKLEMARSIVPEWVDLDAEGEAIESSE